LVSATSSRQLDGRRAILGTFAGAFTPAAALCQPERSRANTHDPGMEFDCARGLGGTALERGCMSLSAESLRRDAGSTGFRPEILEKVDRLLDLLELMQRHPYLKSRLALKGGTALNL